MPDGEEGPLEVDVEHLVPTVDGGLNGVSVALDPRRGHEDVESPLPFNGLVDEPGDSGFVQDVDDH